jgi:hypothetical protein
MLCALVSACVVLLACPAGGLAASHAFRPTADSYVRSDRPHESFGTSRRFSVRRASGQVRRAYLRFDVRLPAGEIPTGAALWLYAQSRGGRHAVAVRKASRRRWSQRTLTWRRAPGAGRLVASARGWRRHHWLQLDVGAAVRSPGPVNLVLTSRSRSWQGFASREDRRHAPRLVVFTAPGSRGRVQPPSDQRGGGPPGGGQVSAPGAASPSGQPPPAGDLPGWHQVFLDDFNTPVPLGSFPAAVSNTWWAYPSTAHDTTGNGRYDPEKVVSIGGGIMNMFIHTEGGEHLVAAPVPKVTASPKYGQLYGRYAVRFRADALPGYKTAWLLWPDSEHWPGDGEIDFPEANLDETIKGYVHHVGASSGSDQDAFSTSARYPDWHTAVIEWTPGKVVFTLDGQVIGQTTDRIPNSPMHWVLQTETALTGPAPSNSTQGNVQIDWVAAWARG